MSILDIFRSSPSANTQQQPAQQQPAQQGAQQVTQMKTAPGDAATQPAANPPAPDSNGSNVSPLDAFKDIWNTDKVPGQNDFDPANMFQIDPAKINEAVSQFDFSKAVSPEVLEKITAGGPEAQGAFMQAMNQIAQQSFAQSMISNATLVQKAMSQANSHLDNRLKDGIRRQSISSNIRDANPALNNPAAAPIISALENSLATKYPTANPDEIAKMATDFLSQFASIAAGKPAEASTKTSNEPDWEAFFNAPPPQR